MKILTLWLFESGFLRVSFVGEPNFYVLNDSFITNIIILH